ncbi:DUF4815 domain-containing protein [Azospirillum sp. Sh1]|uniref:DUF4815 domain-containing protein n=1 Tax=Azospirillum sp. Sh1 TaxID=2607285 RepID=UPI0011F02394|nr:DUF4815 domain-containing protein [Azospirillum sp. Sh1]KAA0571070.1 DUF4815 domain-containing protein [Azospirillum sp. Sh1]
MTTYPDGYYDNWNAAKGYDRILFRSDRVLQTAELNEMQQAAQHRVRGLGDALFKDGAVLRDASLYVDAVTGQTKAAAGEIYAAGAVREVGEASFVLPLDRLVAVGIYLQEAVVTELEDPELFNPARDSRAVGQPGAARLKISVVWGYDQDGKPGDFFPVYRVDRGNLLSNDPPPTLDSVNVALARRDKATTGGTYITSGLTVAYQGAEGAEQVFTITEGAAHIDGFEVTRPTSLRIRFPADPDLQLVDVEPHTFTVATGGSQRIDLNHGPVAAIDTVRATVRIVDEVRTHGNFTNAIDPLANGSVVRVLAVNQGGTWNGTTYTGGTTYAAGTDYRLTGDAIDWSLSGAEPSPGSTYKVTYERLTTLPASAVDETGFTVSGAVQSTQVLVTYKWKLPRVDRVLLNRDGTATRVRGVAHPFTPGKPAVPPSTLLLATVYQTWTGAPTVQLDGDVVHAVPYAELQQMRQDISDLFFLVANDRLQNKAQARDPAAKRGVFVDPFLDGSMRDVGLSQNAAVVAGELTLPIVATVASATQNNDKKFTLTYTLEPVIEQKLRTTTMKINPYQAFEALPAQATLVIAVDQWTQTVVTDAHDDGTTAMFANRTVYDPGYHGSNLTYQVRKTETSIVSAGQRAAETLRPITVFFEVKGFGPGEQLSQLKFDGLTLAPAAA